MNIITSKKGGYRSLGFTLIELLVVISIIGMLSSVVMVSLNGAREKAIVSAGQKFDTHTYRAFGANASVAFDFDEVGYGNTVYDVSGNGNNGTITNATRVSGFNSVGALNFTTSPASHVLTPSNTIGLPDSNNYSISAWIKPTSVSSYQTIVGWGTNNGHGTAAILSINAGKILFDTWWTENQATKSNITANKWSHIVVSVQKRTSDLSVNFYQDGKLLDQNTITDSIDTIPTKPSSVFIGYNNFFSARPYGGLIDSVRIYKQALQAGDVMNVYAEGLKTHQLADAK